MPIEYLPKSDNYLITCSVRLCYLHVCRATLELATEYERNHNCPRPGGSTHYSWEITMNIVESIWATLDREYDHLENQKLRGHDDEGIFVPTQKARLRGMAEVLQMFMSPHFRTTEEIVREVVHRKKMRDAGESYETPGIGSRRYEMPRYEPSTEHKATQTERQSIQERNAQNVSRRHQTPKAKPTAKIINADSETQAAIAGLKGFAEANEVASIYGVPVEDVETIWQN